MRKKLALAKDAKQQGAGIHDAGINGDAGVHDGGVVAMAEIEVAVDDSRTDVSGGEPVVLMCVSTSAAPSQNDHSLL